MRACVCVCVLVCVHKKKCVNKEWMSMEAIKLVA